MSRNILVLTGSPRKGGNSDLLADAFIKGAKAAGNRVDKYETGLKRIVGCKACDRCYSQGEACVFGDDFNALAPLMEQSDTLVLVTPMYWFTFPTPLKASNRDEVLVGRLRADPSGSPTRFALWVCGDQLRRPEEIGRAHV